MPSLNPDGQIMVTDWYNKVVGTPFEATPLPDALSPYTGHDNNRDMYLFSQKESRMAAQVLWHEWFPAIWLDEHQQGMAGPRIFTMPATDPINPNVDPLIYRLNGFFGQSQAAALEAEGKTGIIFNSTYTNFWQGAMAWAGWWHNQVGLLTEVASARIATPVVQQMADPARAVATAAAAGGGRGTATGPANAPAEFEAERRRASSIPTTRCRRRAISRRAPNIRAPGSAADGPCATSWITSSPPPSRCSKPRPTGARRCSTRSTTSIATPSRPASPARSAAIRRRPSPC